MTVLEEALAANQRYAAAFDKGDLPAAPAKRLAVVTCMDARIMPDQVLGLGTGDAHVIRNAGAIVSDDALRSLIVSHHLLRTNTFFVLGHSDCGMGSLNEEGLRGRLSEESGVDASGLALCAFDDADESVRRQVARIRSSPFVPEGTVVRGFVYQVEDGRLR